MTAGKSHHLSVGRNCDLLFSKRIFKGDKTDIVMIVFRYQQTGARGSPANFEEIRCHVVRGLLKRKLWGSLRCNSGPLLTTSKTIGASQFYSLSPTAAGMEFCQPLCELRRGPREHSCQHILKNRWSYLSTACKTLSRGPN